VDFDELPAFHACYVSPSVHKAVIPVAVSGLSIYRNTIYQL